MNIRKLSQHDAKVYQVLRLKALKENPEYYGSSFEEESAQPLSFFENRLNQEHTYAYGAFLNDQLIGTLVMAKETRQKTKHIATLYAMYVDKDYRRIGAAKALLSHAIDEAKVLGVERIRLSVTQTNIPAFHLYEAIGFVVYGIEPHAIKIGHSDYHMVHMNLTLT